MSATRSIAVACVALVGLLATSSPTAAQTANRQYSQVLRLLGCLAQDDPLLGLGATQADPKSLRVRYMLGVEKISANGGATTRNQLRLIIYGKDDKTAVYYAVWPELQGAFVRRNSGLLSRRGRDWLLTEIDEGLIGTYKIEQRHVEELSRTPMRTIPRSAIHKPAGECWVNPH